MILLSMFFDMNSATANFIDATLLLLVAGPIILWRTRAAANLTFKEDTYAEYYHEDIVIDAKRLYVEICITLFLTELIIMALLPLFKGLNEIVIDLFDASLLALISGPLILWRTRAAADRSLRLKLKETAFQVNTQWPALLLTAGVLLLGIGLTTLAIRMVRKSITDHAEKNFNHQADVLSFSAEKNLKQNIYGLESIRDLYATVDKIERMDFRSFIAARTRSKSFLGVRGFGMIQRVKQADLERFIKVEQNDDAPDFAVHPKTSSPAPLTPLTPPAPSNPSGPSADLYVLKYIEPLDPNRHEWGQNLGANLDFRAEIERAIRTGEPTLATLNTVTPDNPSKDTLVFLLAIYRNGTQPKTPEERKVALVGVIYAPLVLKNVFAGMDTTATLAIDFEFFSGIELKKSAFLYDSDDEEPSLTTDTAHTTDANTHDLAPQIRSFELGGRPWTLGVHTSKNYDSDTNYRTPSSICAAGGILLTALLTTLMMLMSGERARALLLARGMTRDLEKAKNIAEAALRKKEALIQVLNLHSLISITDTAGTITYANDAFCKVSGYTHDELVGHTHRKIHSGVQGKEFWPTIWQQLTTGKPWQGEVCNKAKDGSLYWLAVTISPLTDTTGKIEKYISIRTEITSNKLTEMQLKTLVRNLKEQTQIAQHFAVKAGEANTAKSEFLANVSHEIRTPMNGVLGMTELLLHTDLNENQKQITQTIKRSGEVLLTLINDLLDFSKIEAGKFTLEEVDFDLNLLLDNFAEVLAIRAQEKNLEIVCTIDAAVPLLLRGDPGRLRQILTNLAGNAIKFSNEGAILVRVSTLSDSGDDVVLRVSVKDNGIGIPTSQRDKLFQSFSQVDGSSTRKRDGTGLGLVISKQLTQLMGGEIGVNSVAGKGSEFWFTAHLKRQPKQDFLLAVNDVSGKSILIIEHLPETREALRIQLTQRGMLLTEVDSAPQALQSLTQPLNSKKPFDVILLDTALLGSELLGRTLQIDERLRKIPLILMMPISSQAKGDTRRFDGIDFAALLTKPVRRDDLFKCVGMALASAEESTVSQKSCLVQKSTARPLPNAPADPHTSRILVAEDNKVNQQVALGMLKTLGYTADIANNGIEALIALEKMDYALVFMDMMMPEMDGLVATEKIRNEKSLVKNHQIPIIAMTANIASSDRKKCIDIGMDDYISKPISMSVLKKTLDKWLSAEKPKAEQFDAEPIPEIAHIVPLVFDQNGLIHSLDGDMEFAHTLAKMFVQDIPIQIKHLGELLQKNDVKQCEIQAHAIKGAAMTLRGEALRAVAYDLERCAKAGDFKSFATLFPALSVQFEKLKKALQEFNDSY